MRLGEFNVFDAINTLGYYNSQWLCRVYTEQKSVKEETGFGTDEKVLGFIVFVWIEKEDEIDILLFEKNCIKPKYKLKNDVGATLLVFEFVD